MNDSKEVDNPLDALVEKTGLEGLSGGVGVKNKPGEWRGSKFDGMPVVDIVLSEISGYAKKLVS